MKETHIDNPSWRSRETTSEIDQISNEQRYIVVDGSSQTDHVTACKVRL